MIVWLASYPRSGNTLLRMILHTYFNQVSFSKYNDKLDIGADQSLAELVGHVVYEDNWEAFYQRAKASEKLHFIKTHDAPENDDKAIYIVRDGRASAASYLNYLSNFSNLEYDFSDVVAGAVSFGSWDNHLDKWDPLNRPNTLLLRYEDLISTPEAEVEKISAFLGLNVSSGEVPKFEDLKSEHPKFFPVGGNQKNAASISNEELQHLIRNFGPWMKTLGYLEDISFDEGTSKQIAVKHNQKVLSYKREILERKNQTGSTTVEGSLRNFKETITQDVSENIRHELAAVQKLYARNFDQNERSYESLKQISLAGQHAVKNEVIADIAELNKTLTQSFESLENQHKKEVDQNETRFQTLADARRKGQTSNQKQIVGKIEKLNRNLLENLKTAFKELDGNKDDELNDTILQLSEQIGDISGVLFALQTSQKDRESLTDISHKYISELEDKNSRLESAISAAYDSLSHEKTKSQRLRHRIRELADTHDAMLEKLYEYSYVLQPRFKSILELRPIRHILEGRKTIKANGGIPPLNSFQFESKNTPAEEIIAVAEPQPREQNTVRSYNLPVTPSFNPVKTKEPLGVAVYTFDRQDMVHNVLESLAQQGVLDIVNVWIDGDQGNPKRRKAVDKTEALVRQYPVKKVRRNRGNYGFRKMMLTSQRYMLERYEKIIFLEDDCFPCDLAIESFSEELDRIKDDPTIFSVYGHPFLVPGEGKGFGRFQGWGWGTTSEKLEPILKELLSLYLLTEEEYLEWVKQNLTPEIVKKIDVTPGRSPVDTITKFFAWDELTCMLTAMHNQTHKRSDRRLIYNCGVGESSAHFSRIEHYMKPPFNMVSPKDIWDYF